jgi:tRNA dimethylallyltransferase
MSEPVVFIMGATACGKTELSLQLANKLNAEIISVDSALVYRGLDIGTAKPDFAERQGVQHHLIDICEPWQNYSAARFCEDACRLIAQIQERGKKVLLVGGTMLYFKALESGLARLPDADRQVRNQLSSQAEKAGWASLHRELQQVDPAAAKRIHPNDPQRIVRALEVYRLAGEPLSYLQKKTTGKLAVPPVKFALVPNDRSWLHNRIEQRFESMIQAGFMNEMQRLYDNPRIEAELPAMRSVGYRQAWQYIQGGKTDELWKEKAVAATRQLAKRQLTWLRGMSNVNIIACDLLSLEQQTSAVLDDVDKRFVVASLKLNGKETHER